jgi:hypothetical protein
MAPALGLRVSLATRLAYELMRGQSRAVASYAFLSGICFPHTVDVAPHRGRGGLELELPAVLIGLGADARLIRQPSRSPLQQPPERQARAVPARCGSRWPAIRGRNRTPAGSTRAGLRRSHRRQRSRRHSDLRQSDAVGWRSFGSRSPQLTSPSPAVSGTR